MTAIPSYDFGGQVAFVTAASSGMAASQSTAAAISAALPPPDTSYEP
jgi:hypothetical protein